jgi:adenine-specific DNA-methyltransferase
MGKYTCEKCGHEFQQKSHFTRHGTKKNPCIQEPKQKKLGQYFTVNESLQQFVYDKVKNKGELLLEPSFGAGHLLKKFKESNTNYPIICYELDSTVKPIMQFNEHQTLIYGDFTQQIITRNFKTIIGNPPYIKQTSGNLYIKFIELCYALLDSGGELIFIVPSDFIKLTSAAPIIQTMMANGSFTDFFFPHDEKLFENANIDVCVFRYQKGLILSSVTVNDKKMICNAQNGIITFSVSDVKGTPLSEQFNAYVGLVSGRDEIYRAPFGNLKILNDKDRIDTFIFINSFPSTNEQINAHLLANKDKLLERKIRKFTDVNWFEWGAPRNIKSIETNLGKPCIYVRNMTRNKEVAFLGTVQHFGGSLLCLMPVAPANLKKVVDFLNTTEFQKDYMYSGRFKIGHKQLCNVIVPS